MYLGYRDNRRVWLPHAVAGLPVQGLFTITFFRFCARARLECIGWFSGLSAITRVFLPDETRSNGRR